MEIEDHLKSERKAVNFPINHTPNSSPILFKLYTVVNFYRQAKRNTFKENTLYNFVCKFICGNIYIVFNN